MIIETEDLISIDRTSHKKPTVFIIRQIWVFGVLIKKSARFIGSEEQVFGPLESE